MWIWLGKSQKERFSSKGEKNGHPLKEGEVDGGEDAVEDGVERLACLL